MDGRFYLEGNNAIGVSPCKDCERRAVGCHSTCPDYAEYKNKLDHKNDAAAVRRVRDDAVIGYYKDQVKKRERRKNK